MDGDRWTCPKPEITPQITPLDVSALYREHAAWVSRLLSRFGVRERDRADLTQEVFVIVHQRAHEFEGRAHVSTWLYRIAWNIASADKRRARHKRELLPSDASEAHAHSHALTPSPEAETHLKLLLGAIDALPEGLREVFVRYELYEHGMREVAEQLSLPLKTAFSRLYLARARLRTSLRAQGFSSFGFALWWVWPARSLPWLAPKAWSTSASSSVGAHASSAKLGTSLGSSLGSTWGSSLGSWGSAIGSFGSTFALGSALMLAALHTAAPFASTLAGHVAKASPSVQATNGTTATTGNAMSAQSTQDAARASDRTTRTAHGPVLQLEAWSAPDVESSAAQRTETPQAITPDTHARPSRARKHRTTLVTQLAAAAADDAAETTAPVPDGEAKPQVPTQMIVVRSGEMDLTPEPTHPFAYLL